MNATKNPVGRPTADTLIDRYLWAVLKALPESKRTDIDRELRASIADAVDARVDAGEEPQAAERTVLLELGEPTRLAAGYAGRPLSLIGPDLYIDYLRLLKLLLWIVVPIVAVTMFVINALTGTGPGGLIGGTIGVVVGVVVHLCFWTTLVFVIVERTGAAKPGGVTGQKDSWVPFDPDDLPAIPTATGAGRGDLIASLVFLLFVPVALVWQQFSSVIRDADGDAIPLIDPALWSFWLPYLLVLTALSAVFAIVLHRVGRWTWPLVAVNAVLTVATTAPIVWLIWTGNLLNDAFLDHFGWGEYVAEGSPAAIATSAAIVLIAVWAIIDGAYKTVQADRMARAAAA